tara:strand:- start:2162 stop:2320 length:159 start_codon:yes stop_codon:yes gene_type:complete
MTKITTYDDQNNILATYQFYNWSDAIDFACETDMMAGNIRESDIVKFTVEKI